MRTSPSLRTITVAGTLVFVTSAMAKAAPGGPPAVGVVKAEYRPMTESTEIAGRIQARERVDLDCARHRVHERKALHVKAPMSRRTNCSIGWSGRLSRPTWKSRRQRVAQAQAQLDNADTALGRAREELLAKNHRGRRLRSTMRVGSHRERRRLNCKSAKAQLQQAADQSLTIPRYRAPISGPYRPHLGDRPATWSVRQLGRSGHDRQSGSDVCRVSDFGSARVIELRDRYTEKGGLDAVQVRLRLPNGRTLQSRSASWIFTISASRKDTDTLLHLRATIDNPVSRPRQRRAARTDRRHVCLGHAGSSRTAKGYRDPARRASCPISRAIIVYVVNSDNKWPSSGASSLASRPPTSPPSRRD